MATNKTVFPPPPRIEGEVEQQVSVLLEYLSLVFRRLTVDTPPPFSNVLTGDGETTSFDIGFQPVFADFINVFINGLHQTPSIDYVLPSTRARNIVFTEPPADGAIIYVVEVKGI